MSLAPSEPTITLRSILHKLSTETSMKELVYIFAAKNFERGKYRELGHRSEERYFFSEWGKFKLGLPCDCGSKKRALGQMVGNSGYDTILPYVWSQRLWVVLQHLIRRLEPLGISLYKYGVSGSCLTFCKYQVSTCLV